MIEILSKFYESRPLTKEPGELAPFEWYSLQHKTAPFHLAPYFHMLEEHTREIANSVNEFNRYIVNLETWKNVIQSLDNESKNEAIVEWIHPFATLAINIVYVIRSRFIYSIAHLCHQANRVKMCENWTDDFPIEEEVYFNVADEYCCSWRGYKKLKLALEKIGNTEFKKKTNNFRDKYHHRYSLHFEIGDSEFVKRKIVNGKVTYGLFGSTKPIMLSSLVPVLEKQYEYCRAAYSRYQELLNTQISIVEKSIL